MTLRHTSITALAALTLAAGAAANDITPPACAPDAKIGLVTEAEMHEAALKCDVARAEELATISDQLFNASNPYLLRIVETRTLGASGDAYVYDLIDMGDGQVRLDVRSVPGGESPNWNAASYRLIRDLTPAESGQLMGELQTVTAPGNTAYDPREEVTINPDGSRNVRLLLDTRDIVTFSRAPLEARVFSRHTESSDAMADITARIMQIANLSDGWQTNPPQPRLAASAGSDRSP